MTKIKLFTHVLPIVIAVCIGSFNLFAQSQKTEIPIYVDQNNPVKLPHPKSPAAIPIEAYFNKDMNVIILNFRRNIGVLDVQVCNQSTGEYLEGSINAEVGFSTLQISGTVGFYQISFLLIDGTTYIGKFEISEV